MLKQKEEHEHWLKKEGGIERPTLLETLLQPEQRKRIEWLKKRCFPATEILDIGCNWGYVLNEVNGKCGVDINLENIEKAIKSFPTKYFFQSDVTKGLPFDDDQYAIVLLADILEHLEWFADVKIALREALRIARRKVLITLPWRQDSKCALCFKHKWIPDEGNVGAIITHLMRRKTTIECDGTFVYIEVQK